MRITAKEMGWMGTCIVDQRPRGGFLTYITRLIFSDVKDVGSSPGNVKDGRERNCRIEWVGQRGYQALGRRSGANAVCF